MKEIHILDRTLNREIHNVAEDVKQIKESGVTIKKVAGPSEGVMADADKPISEKEEAGGDKP